MARNGITTILTSHWAPILLTAFLVVCVLVAPRFAEWHYEPILESEFVVGLIALGLIALTALRPTFREVTSVKRIVLTSFRLAVVLLVVVFMLRPTCVTTKTTEQTASLVILFDQSRSMTLPHKVRDKTRWQAQIETLSSNASILRELSENLDIKVYAYDGQLHEVEISDGEITFPRQPPGDQTDIGTPLSEAVEQERGQRLAAVILLGDGEQTAFDPRVEIWDAVDELAELEHPLYTVAFGSETAAEDARDVAVENLPDQYSVFVKNELLVRAAVRARGYVNKEIPVQLLVEDSIGEEKLVDTVRVTPRQDDEQLDVQMTYVPQQAGQYRLVLRAEDQAGEQVKKNNELSAFLTVLEGGLRVLYLEGDVRWETKFLKNAVDASQDIELDIQSFDAQKREDWPVDLADDFADPQYDVFIIGDLDSRALYEKDRNEDNMRALVAAVEQGKGLMMLGGYHAFGPGLYKKTPLADVLPIKMDDKERQDFDPKVMHDLHVNHPLRLMPALPHYLTYLALGDENEAKWQSLPPMKGANRFVGVKDRAQVLLEGRVLAREAGVLRETAERVPILVAGEYGTGRVLAFAADSTWRWSMQGRQEEHKRFWRQLVLWLAKRDDLEQENVWIQLTQRRFHQGSEVEFTAGAKTAAGDVIRNATFDAEVIRPDGKRQPISLLSRGDEHAGRLDNRETNLPGTYTIEVTGRSAEGKALGTVRAKFMVFDHDRELSNPAANLDQLARMAEMTKGGRPVAPEELADLLLEIKRRPPDLKIEIPRRWQLGDNTFDAWILFLCVVGLLTAEWALRKKWGLV